MHRKTLKKKNEQLQLFYENRSSQPLIVITMEQADFLDYKKKKKKAADITITVFENSRRGAVEIPRCYVVFLRTKHGTWLRG